MKRRFRRDFLASASLTALAGLSGCVNVAFEPPQRDDYDENRVSRQNATGTPLWPQIGHDAWNTNYNAAVKGLREHVEITWRAPLSGKKLNQPVVADAVYCAEWWDDTAFALHRDTGSVRWHQSVSPMRWPPTVVGEHVLCISRAEGNHVTLHALNLSDGTLDWETSITASNGDLPPIGPTVADDRVFIATDQGVLAMDGATGNIQWSTNLDQYVTMKDVSWQTTWAKPAVRGDYVYTFDRNGRGPDLSLYALDRTSGERQWKRTFEIPDEPSELRPDLWSLDNHVIAGETRLFVTMSGGERRLLSSSHTESAPAAGGRLLVVDPDTGGVHQTYDFDGQVSVSALGEGMLYVPISKPGAEPNEVQAIDIENQRVKWRQEFDQIINSVSATDDAVYVSGMGLEAVDASDGTPLWKKFNDRAVGTAVIAGDTIYVRYESPETGEKIQLAALHQQ